MRACLDPRQKQQAEAMFPDLALFTAEECAEVEALLRQIAPRWIVMVIHVPRMSNSPTRK